MTALIASCTTGLAVGWLASLITRLVTRPVATTAEAWDFEGSRRVRLRAGSSVFRWFEPLVDELAAYHKLQSPKRVETVRSHLQTVNLDLPWLPEEFIAARQLEAMLGAAFAFAVGWLYGGPLLGVVLALALGMLLTSTGLGDLRKKAERKVAAVRRRLPYAVDLAALMLEAGGGLNDTLETLATDMRGTPLGDELRIILNEMNLGRPLRECLLRFSQRVPNDDIAELVFMINKGDEFGTPMAQTFRIQSDQMRLKRSQWAEKEAGAAQVAIVMPGMLIMIACLLIIGAPFVLAAFESMR